MRHSFATNTRSSTYAGTIDPIPAIRSPPVSRNVHVGKGHVAMLCLSRSPHMAMGGDRDLAVAALLSLSVFGERTDHDARGRESSEHTDSSRPDGEDDESDLLSVRTSSRAVKKSRKALEGSLQRRKRKQALESRAHDERDSREFAIHKRRRSPPTPLETHTLLRAWLSLKGADVVTIDGDALDLPASRDATRRCLAMFFALGPQLDEME